MRKLSVLPALCLWLAGCQTTERPDVSLRRDFPEVELNRIGDFHPAYSDYQDVAVLNALLHAVKAGVPKESLRVATVAPSHSTGVAPLVGAQGYPSYYEVWLKIASCDALVYMKANFRGRLFSVRDKAACLPGAPKPSSTTVY